MKKIYIAPSTDPAKDEETLIAYAKQLQENGADFLHCDVMDGHFVERETINDKTIAKVNQNTVIPLDVHLMIEKPWRKIKKYLTAGANILVVHREAFDKPSTLIKTLRQIREGNCMAGLATNPSTNVEDIIQFLPEISLLLVMSVEPGKSGQSFIPATYKKVEELHRLRQKQSSTNEESHASGDLPFLIEVDGGVNPEIAKKLIELGADMLVSGNFIYKSENQKLSIKQLRGEA